jgi:hypothetical protein
MLGRRFEQLETALQQGTFIILLLPGHLVEKSDVARLIAASRLYEPLPISDSNPSWT